MVLYDEIKSNSTGESNKMHQKKDKEGIDEERSAVDCNDTCNIQNSIKKEKVENDEKLIKEQNNFSSQKVNHECHSEDERNEAKLNISGVDVSCENTTDIKDEINNKNTENTKRVKFDQFKHTFDKSITNDSKLKYTSKVALHYNNIPTITREKRKDSTIINLRNINNFIKSMIIQLYVRKNTSVLDLGCGKGGDILKYKKMRIKYFCGIDIAEQSVKECETRIKSVNEPFKYDLYNKDMISEEINLNYKFDIIALQFSLHYAFESKSAFDKLFKTIMNHVKDNTYILITLVDHSTIIRAYNEVLVTDKECGYCKKKNNCFGNSIFHIKFKNFSINNKFGNKYSFTLKEAISDCDEFLVHCGELVNVFEQNGFELIENKGFNDFLNIHSKNFSFLKKRMVPYELKNDEKEVMNLYRVIVFKYVNEKEKEIIK